MDKIKRAGKERYGGVIVCFGIAFLLCVFAPLDIFFTNKKEFWYDFKTIFPYALASFLALGVVLTCLYLLFCRLGEKIGEAVCAVLTVIYLCTYVQGNFLAYYLPVLDGAPIKWEDLGWHRIESIVLWAAVSVIVFGIWKYCRKKGSDLSFVKVCGIGTVLISLMLTVTLISEIFMYNGLEQLVKRKNTMEYAMEFSREKNLIVILLDAVDGDEMSDMLAENPEYQDVFQDFTFYQNTLGVYPFTLYAVPYLISGREYLHGEEDWFQYVTGAYIESPFVDDLIAKDYRVGIYETDLICNSDKYLQFDNVINSANYIGNKRGFLDYQRKLVLYRYLPFDLKRFHVASPDEGSVLKAGGSYFKNTDYYNMINNTDVTYSEQNTFRFYHLEGAHAPFHLDKDLNEVGESTYGEQLESCMPIVENFLNRLKTAGVYDNSAIIVLSDHGCDKESVDSEYGRQHPILFMKGIGEKRAQMNVSMAPISFADMQDAYGTLLEGKNSADVFGIDENADRVRTYYLYNFDDNMHLYECEQQGYAGDADTLVLTGTEY